MTGCVFILRVTAKGRGTVTRAWRLPHIRLCLFGSFHLERDGQTIHFPTRKVEFLLAYLVLHPEPHSREKLAALLWGDFSDDQARASLRNALAVLRRSLPAEIITADRETVQFNPHSSIWVDILTFQNVVAMANHRAHPTLTDIETWQSAADLYRGDLLAEGYDEWLIPLREQLRTAYIHLLLQLTQWWRTRSEYTRAIHYARRILAIEPTNEKAHQNIIVSLIALGDRVAALKQYKECERNLRDELAVEPSLETQALCQWINQSQAQRAATESLLTNLPIGWLDFVGRDTERAELERLIRHHRLVTLTGAGGCGKTSLAIQVASQLTDSFRDGAWWANLASLADEELVLQTIANALGVRESAQQTLEDALAHYLRDKHLLLLLDGCERLVDVTARLVEILLSRCAHLRILVTGREALGIAGEVLWQVQPLATLTLDYWRAKPTVPNATPEIVAELLHFDAIQLFVKRARGVNSRFALDEKNAFAVAEICRRLDGIPLALELAAARTKTMTVAQIADRLGDRFRLLTDGRRTALPHHQTLKAAIDWSYDWLSDAERILFRRLSIFLGGWTLKAAEHIVADTESMLLAPTQILDGLTRLITKSLVATDQQSEGMRYRMLETIREYARQKLIDSGEAAEQYTKHRDWFLHYAEAAEPKLRHAEQSVWLERLEADYENVHAALRWSLRRREGTADDVQKGMRLVVALHQFWAMRGMFKVGRLWCDEALQKSTRLQMEHNREWQLWYAQVLTSASVLAYLHGDLKNASVLCEKSLALARQLEHRWMMAVCLYVLSEQERHLGGACERAFELATEGLALARAEGDPWLTACMLTSVGSHALARGQYAQALAFFTEGLRLAEQVGDQWIASALLEGLGNVAYLQGDCARAVALYERGLALRRALKDQNGIAGLLNNLGRAAYCQGEWTRAHDLFTASLALCQELEQHESTAWVQQNIARVEVKQGNVTVALRLLGSSLAIWQRLGNRSGSIQCLVGVAMALVAQGRQCETAARLFGVVQRWRTEIGVTVAPAEQAEFDAYLCRARAVVGEATFDAAWAQGYAMSLEESVDYTLWVLGHT